MKPTVSILLPVYNGSKYLGAAIQSIVGQTYRDWELLVLDDGSTDESVSVARSFVDERIRVLPNGENRGVAKTLNRGMSLAEGSLIARMDADDESMPDRLVRQVSFLQENEQVGLLGTNALSAETGEATFAVPLDHGKIRSNLLFNCSFLHPTVMWRAALFRENGLSYEETPTAEDYDLWERACGRITAANLPDQLLRYRNDPEVKVTAYVRQQKEGGRRVRERALRGLGLEPSDEDLEVHHACAYDNLPQPAVALSRVDRWFGSILEANRRSKVLSEDSLRERLQLQRYYHIMRNRPSIGVREIFYAGSEMGRVPAATALRTFLKRVVMKSQ
tara:strand:- start:1407 stop:2405 length:999 start_codon:yes stop_codon:yes gene_type:complete